MAISLVSNGGGATGTDSVGPSFGAETTEGNFLVAFATSNSVSESFPIYQPVSGWYLVASAGGDYNWAGLWFKPDCGADETPPSFEDSGATAMAASLAEFSGVAILVNESIDPTDQSGSYYGFPSQVSAGGVDTVAGDLIVGVATWNGSNDDIAVSVSISDSSGETLDTVQLSWNGGSEPFWAFGYAVGPATLGSVPDVSAGDAGEYENEPVNIVASFKPAS